MRIHGKVLALICLAAATQSEAQSVNAPSAVSTIAPLSQPLSGTLFFDQQQRERMDRARVRGIASFEGVSIEPAPSVLSGFVKRSDGKSVIWVDGYPRYDVQSDGVGHLQPQDVGGANEFLRILPDAGQAPGVKLPNDKATAKAQADRQKRPTSKTDKR